MSEVYANGNAIASKASGGKVIAAFPDVCLSPPSPPAGPIPVPYPDTSFSKDMKKGSKKVKIGNKEVMLKDKSFYKSSPLGDEAATKSFGANVLTHVITGKTYFGAWSMDVKFEGENVPRHIDLTTSNHGSYPGGSGPMINGEKLALARIAEDKCPCCGGAKHANGEPMNRDEWYEDNLKENHNQRNKELNKQLEEQTKKVEELANQNPKRFAKAVNKLAQISTKYTDESKKLHEQKSKLRNLMHRAKTRPGCKCKKPAPPLLPSPPCDMFFQRPPPGVEREEQQDAIEERWNNYRAKHVGKARTPPALVGVKKSQQVNHLTPKSAGGCPTGDGNLQSHEALCSACQAIDFEFNDFQS